MSLRLTKEGPHDEVERGQNDENKVAKSNWNKVRTKTFAQILAINIMDKKGDIDLHIVVDSLRFAAFSSFALLILIGIILTQLWGGIPNNTVIEKNLGNRNICLYFDFRPITYVAPPLYTIVVMFVAAYACAANIRVKIALLEEEITTAQKNFFYFCHGFFSFGTIMFTLCFAVQPLDHESLMVHTLPFTILIIAMVFNQIAVVWFGDLSSLKIEGDNISGESKYFVPDWSRILGKVALAIQIVVSLGKVIFQINALGIWEHGWFLYVHDPKYVIVATMIDWTWFVLSFISPIVESAYFRFHHPYETVNINLKLSHGRKKKEELPEEL